MSKETTLKLKPEESAIVFSEDGGINLYFTEASDRDVNTGEYLMGVFQSIVADYNSDLFTELMDRFNKLTAGIQEEE